MPSSRPAPRTWSTPGSAAARSAMCAPTARAFSTSPSRSIACEHGERGRGDRRRAAERGRVVAALEAVVGLVGREQRADRQAAAEALGDGDGVGPHAESAGSRTRRRSGRRRSAPRRAAAARRGGRRARARARATRCRSATRRPRPGWARPARRRSPARRRRRARRGRSAARAGSRRARARTARAWRPTSRRRASPACGRGRRPRGTRSRAWPGPPRARPRRRASLIAASTASAPELQKNARSRPASAHRRSASAIIGSVQKRFETCPSTADCSASACTGRRDGRGRASRPRGRRRGRGTRCPSSSQTVQPTPRTSASGRSG